MQNGHMNFFIPQWQGAGQDMGTYNGGFSLIEKYMDGVDMITAPISTDPISPTIHNIRGYIDIMNQQKAVRDILAKIKPQTIFTIGGGCDADLDCITYLNKLYDGEMALVYLDAHGDINSPEESQSGRFYGMPVRCALGEGEQAMVAGQKSTLHSSQVFFGAIRDLDDPEWNYIRQHDIAWFLPTEIEQNPICIADALVQKGFSRAYVHIDVDALDPEDFSHISVPVAEGISCAALKGVLGALNESIEIVGLGFLEYCIAKGDDDNLIESVFAMGRSLNGTTKS